jgi:hypothetical protein
MDLTIGSLHFRVGSLGSIRLSNPTKSDPSAGKTVTMAISESSVGSSSEVNSPVSFTTMENIEDKIKELDKTMENLDLGEQPEDFMICCGSISDKSTDTWKTGLELHEDNQTTLCRGDDLWGMPRAELFASWHPRSLHSSKTRRPAPPGGPAVPTADWRFHRGRPEPGDEDKSPPTAVLPKVVWPR